MGYYRSAEGAALAYARSIGADASKIKAAKVKAQPRAQSQACQLLAELGNIGPEQAVRLAEAEGLTLVRSARSKSGFKHARAWGSTPRPPATAAAAACGGAAAALPLGHCRRALELRSRRWQR